MIKKIMKKLFQKKQKPVVLDQIEFNAVVIDKAISAIHDKMYGFKDEECLTEIKSLLKLGKNKALLVCATASTDKELFVLQAKVHVYDEILSFIDQAIQRKAQDKKEGRKAVPGTFNTYRRTGGQAGLSM